MQTIDLSMFHPYEMAYQPNARLGDYAYSLCGGPCDGLFLIENSEMLKFLAKKCIFENNPFKVLGGMSNVLVSDEGFRGIILLNREGIIEKNGNEGDSILLTVDSGTSMASLVRYCREKELSGFEWAAGLPGTVGGAVYGNAGAFGTEIKDLFRFGILLNASGSEIRLSQNDMEFKYRSSMLKNRKSNCVLLKAVFALKKDQREAIAAREESNREKRRASQPVSERSLGSVFKNPEGYSAGKLIQDSGLKGKSIGQAVVSTKHANFITTSRGVRSEDYRQLVMMVQRTVSDKFGINLDPEIEFIGFEEQ